MSYIIKKNDPMVNVKLTDVGRNNLASGKLTFTYFGLGDGEMDYSSDNTSLINILRPTDNPHDIQYPVPSESGVYKLPISILTSKPNEVISTAKERGFFTITTTGVTTGTTIDNSLCLVNNLEGYGTGSTLFLTYTANSTTNDYSKIVKAGDYLFVKFLTTGYTSSGTTQTEDEITLDPIPYLMYAIESVSGTTNYDLTGYTIGVTLPFTIDRDLPNFDSYIVNAFIYPGPETIRDYYDNQIPIAYWSGGLLDFTTNCTQANDDVPVWNMNIVTIEDVIGLDSSTYKGKYNAKSRNYWGTAVNYDYFLNNPINKVGIIHYTNNTVSNFYGEGFYRNTFKLNIPYLMWHKKQFGGSGLANEIGYTFICDSTLKTTSNNIRYYDLIDQETSPTVVGKVLPNQKLVLIEHQELIAALCYKSNRNWTLPKPKLTQIEPGACVGSSVIGSLQSEEAIHISYLFMDNNGISGIQCEDYTTAENRTTSPKDIIFEFPKDNSDPTYSEFGYLMDYVDINGYGYRTNDIILLWQKTPINSKPNATEWKYINANRFVGGNGCLSTISDLCDNFELYTESSVYPTNFINYKYGLTKTEIGSVLVSYNGQLLKEATTSANIGIDGDYYKYLLTEETSITGKSVIKINPTLLVGTPLIQFHYLVGTSNSSETIRQDYEVPLSGISTGSTYLDGIYFNTINGRPSLTLDYQPNNSVVYLFYNGLLISSNNYGVIPTGTTENRRVELLFTPSNGSKLSIFYLDSSGLGSNPVGTAFTSNAIANLRIFLDKSLLDTTEDTNYNLNDIVSLPLYANTTGFTFGDEIFFYGNISTDIKATIYKSLITCNVLPNKFITTANPTFNPNQDKVAFTEIAIYDEDDDMVAIGKFSEPLTRTYNSDMLIIQVTIDI